MPINIVETYSYPHKHFTVTAINAPKYARHLYLMLISVIVTAKPINIGINHVNSTQYKLGAKFTIHGDVQKVT